MDRQELSGGVWDRAYEYFGAHPCDGGWVFRVWAPQARHVALCGDFNGWQRWDMHRLEDGTWELTVENAKQFDGYQYVVTQCDGREVWKADPYGFHQETRPSTNSKLYDIGGFPWHDEKWRYPPRRGICEHLRGASRLLAADRGRAGAELPGHR